MFGRLLSAARVGVNWFDGAVTAGLIVLLAFAPFAFGAVHQWAYTLTETAQFALLIVWMARIWMEGATPARLGIASADLAGLAVPAALFTLLLVFQVAPIPPALMRVISPATYRLYAQSFPGWPETAPYHALRAAWSPNPRASAPQVQLTLPPVGGKKEARVRAAAPETAAKSHAAAPERPSPATLGHFGDLRWRSISIAPSVTWAGLIEMLACGAIFFVVLSYPFGLVGAEREADARFMRRLVGALITIGGAVALIGLAQKAAWNGRILWFFVPQDWSGLPAVNVRASGPFVNPDHFANFLAMILPLAVVGAIFPIAPGHRERGTDMRLQCAVAAFLISAGILLSLSRGAWIASVAGVCVGLGLSFSHARERAPDALRNLGSRALPFALAGSVVLLLAVLFVIGPSARSEAGARIGATIAQGDSLGFKPAAWRDSLRMIGDFPIFGVGLGCWPELFPHYQRPPWMPFYFREPENDYIQFVAETGLAGSVLVLWFGAVTWRKIRAAAARLSARQWPLLAGIGAGIAAAMVHEFFDFSLHTPANALLFTVLLAAMIRVALTRGVERRAAGLRSVTTPSKYTYVGAAGIAAGAAALIFAAQIQENAAYPYDIGIPKTFAQAEAAAVAHPGDSGVHLALVALMPPGAPAALRHQELRAAVWLNPNDPLARDVYARSLFLDGKKREGLEQIALSVLHAPDLESHYYLQPRVIPWLLPDEQRAIYEGFAQAIAAGYEGSAHDLAGFYRQLGRNAEAAQVSATAADATDDDTEKMNYLLDAGHDYALAHKMKEAQEKLRSAIEIDQADARPYRELMVDVFGPARDMKGVRGVAQEAVANGADRVAIDIALADAARAAGDMDAAEAALNEVVKYEPTFATMMSLGQLYADERKFDRATIAYQHATEIDPASARAYFSLGQAEEAAFDYGAANRDYARALKLAPTDKGMHQAYLDFRQRTAQLLKQTPGG